MSEEVKVEFECSPHRVNNANVVRDHLTQTTNGFMPIGWRFKDAEEAELLIYIPCIPTEIHATTPNGKVRISWCTASSSTNNVKWFVALNDIAANSDSYDPAAWDMDTSGTDANNGAYVCNSVDVAISGPSLTAGRQLVGTIRRDADDAADTLAADVLLTSVLFVADKA